MNDVDRAAAADATTAAGGGERFIEMILSRMTFRGFGNWIKNKILLSIEIRNG